MEKRLIPPAIWKLSVLAAAHKAVVSFGRRTPTAPTDELKYLFIDSTHNVPNLIFSDVKVQTYNDGDLIMHLNCKYLHLYNPIYSD